MKTLISILFVMMIVGCGTTEVEPKSEVEKLEEENRRMKAELENKKLKEKLEKDDFIKKIVGSYEPPYATSTSFNSPTISTLILLENGKVGGFIAGTTWKIVGKEVHVGSDIFKIEPNGDLTNVARILYGKRIKASTIWSGHEFTTYKKIKVINWQ